MKSTKAARRTARGPLVQSWDDVPTFASEAEETEWWQSHSLGKKFLDEMRPAHDVDADLPKPRPRTRPLAVRFDDTTLTRLRALADRRHTGYQTLLKEFVIERLYEEEKREGIVGEARGQISRARRVTAKLTAKRADNGGRRRASVESRAARSNVRGRRRTSTDTPPSI